MKKPGKIFVNASNFYCTSRLTRESSSYSKGEEEALQAVRGVEESSISHCSTRKHKTLMYLGSC